MSARKPKEPARIFSGRSSEELWADVWATQKSTPLVFDALYILGCRCQELEAVVRQLEESLARLNRVSNTTKGR